MEYVKVAAVSPIPAASTGSCWIVGKCDDPKREESTIDRELWM
jgi:hypothetical protein